MGCTVFPVFPDVPAMARVSSGQLSPRLGRRLAARHAKLMDVSYREILQASWNQRHGFRSARPADTASDGGEVFGARSAPARLSPSRRLRQQVFTRLVRDLETRGGDGFLKDPQQMRSRVRRILGQALAAADAPALRESERAHIEDQVVAEVLGLGPLEPLFADPTVSDILVNGPNDVWVDRFGRLERTRVRFDDEEHLRRLLARLVSSHGRHLDEGSPAVDVRLADGSRLHAVIPPLAPAPIVSIRRLRTVPFRLEELYECDTLSPAMGRFLAAVVGGGLNVVISGGAASGKTTLLNVLSGFIPAAERVVAIEETAELRLEHPHVVSLEARLPNIEGRGEVTLRTLVRNALRMRPDRIIIGEVRGPEVFDMLQAMNTGHEGSLTTVHANSPQDALRRLENLVHLGGFELPSSAIRELLAAAFDVLVHTTRFLDGSRRVTSIQEVLFEDEKLTTRELFRYREEVRGGRHAATGQRPSFAPRLASAGFDLSEAASDGTGQRPIAEARPASTAPAAGVPAAGAPAAGAPVLTGEATR